MHRQAGILLKYKLTRNEISQWLDIPRDQVGNTGCDHVSRKATRIVPIMTQPSDCGLIQAPKQLNPNYKFVTAECSTLGDYVHEVSSTLLLDARVEVADF